jgi:hypothetical protein
MHAAAEWMLNDDDDDDEPRRIHRGTKNRMKNDIPWNIYFVSSDFSFTTRYPRLTSVYIVEECMRTAYSAKVLRSGRSFVADHKNTGEDARTSGCMHMHTETTLSRLLYYVHNHNETCCYMRCIMVDQCPE